MSKVYIPHIPNRRDRETNIFVPTIDVTPANEYGELVTLLPPTASFHATGDLIDMLRPFARTYNFEDGDCIVAVGDPSILAIVFGLVASMHSKFNLLKWDRSIHRYVKVKIVL